MSWFIVVKNVSFEIPSGRRLQTVELVDLNEYQSNCDGNFGKCVFNINSNLIYC
jgi:hypothetical protein